MKCKYKSCIYIYLFVNYGHFRDSHIHIFTYSLIYRCGNLYMRMYEWQQRKNLLVILFIIIEIDWLYVTCTGLLPIDVLPLTSVISLLHQIHEYDQGQQVNRRNDLNSLQSKFASHDLAVRRFEENRKNINLWEKFAETMEEVFSSCEINEQPVQHFLSKLRSHQSKDYSNCISFCQYRLKRDSHHQTSPLEELINHPRACLSLTQLRKISMLIKTVYKTANIVDLESLTETYDEHFNFLKNFVENGVTPSLKQFN